MDDVRAETAPGNLQNFAGLFPVQPFFQEHQDFPFGLGKRGGGRSSVKMASRSAPFGFRKGKKLPPGSLVLVGIGEGFGAEVRAVGFLRAFLAKQKAPSFGRCLCALRRARQ